MSAETFLKIANSSMQSCSATAFTSLVLPAGLNAQNLFGFYKSVLNYWRSKQQVTSDQIRCVFRQQSYADKATLVVIVTTGYVRSGVGWLVVVLVLPITQKLQCGKKVFSQPPIVQVLPLKKMRGL